MHPISRCSDPAHDPEHPGTRPPEGLGGTAEYVAEFGSI